MEERPNLDIKLDSKTFKEYYYLKEELIDFCKKNQLQTTGGKIELTERIAKFLATGERTSRSHTIRKSNNIGEITLDTIIEENFTCSQNIEHFIRKK